LFIYAVSSHFFPYKFEKTMSQLPTVGHLIDGKAALGGTRSQDVFNPATGKAEKRVLLADKTTVEQAIASAQAALPRLAQHAAAQARPRDGQAQSAAGAARRRMCALITAEHGKVLGDALGELQRGIENVEYASYAPSCSRASTARTWAPASTAGANSSRWA
jgi:malonate-semialdehyde dehydrogenase (acetylating)/methylmalonate-semialdehyde dehydrogenase